MIYKNTYYSHGKLLLSGEYLVLIGAKSLALPTKFGQTLEVKSRDDSLISWKSFDEKNKIWFETSFSTEDFRTSKRIKFSDPICQRCFDLLSFSKKLNPDFLKTGCEIVNKVNFPIFWGLGTSSTLVSNLSSWAEIDPYKLLWSCFQGSGYDIACAKSNRPIFYKLEQQKPQISQADFNPCFSESIFFIYLNTKQNTQDALLETHKLLENKSQAPINEISEISLAMESCQSIEAFGVLMECHENILSSWLKLKKVKNLHFQDYPMALKSLGAWGGDFIMALGEKSDMNYFRNKGYQTIFNYQDIILQ